MDSAHLMKYKRLKLYNYYNGEYKEIDYNYEGGILTYSCDGLGDLIISSKDYNYTWVYVVVSVILCVLVSMITIIGIKKYKRINRYRYKSLSRRKDHGDY